MRDCTLKKKKRSAVVLSHDEFGVMQISQKSRYGGLRSSLIKIAHQPRESDKDIGAREMSRNVERFISSSFKKKKK